MTSILKADTIQDTDGNNIINENSNTITIGASGDTTNIVGTLQNNGAAVGGVMTPAFFARLSSDQSISNETNTIVQFNSEVFDSDSAYDNSSNYRFTIPSGKAGKYFLYTTAQVNYSNPSRLLILKFYKNGSEFGKFTNITAAGNDLSGSIQIVDDASVGDYYDVRIYQNDGTRTISGHSTRNISVFGAFKIIE